MKPHILFVDDEPNVRRGIQRMLWEYEEEFTAEFCENADQALEYMLTHQVDAVFTDHNMPGKTGLEFLQEIKRMGKWPNLPLVMLTGNNDRNLKREALESGATDLISKPVEPEDLLTRIRNMVRIKGFQDELALQNQELERIVKQRTRQLEASRIEVVWRLSKAAETRDVETGLHTMRVGYYATAVARALNRDTDFCDHLLLASPLHDIGKLGISESILQKQGPLTPEERTEMQRHCQIGFEILRSKFSPPRLENLAVLNLPTETSPFIDMAAVIALQHHEKWDGTGYPHRLQSDEIYLGARITAIADVFDALRSARPYKAAFSEDKAVGIIREESGKHFDPHVVQAFLDSLGTIRQIQSELADEPMSRAA